MKAKQYLSQIHRLDSIVNAKLEQVQVLRSLASRITSDMSSERVQTSMSSDKIGSTVAKIVDLEKEINQSIDILIDLKREVMNKIDSIEDDDCRLLLIMRYLNFKHWEHIAVEMNYSYRNIHYLHGKALNEFEKLHSISHQSVVK